MPVNEDIEGGDFRHRQHVSAQADATAAARARRTPKEGNVETMQCFCGRKVEDWFIANENELC